MPPLLAALLRVASLRALARSGGIRRALLGTGCLACAGCVVLPATIGLAAAGALVSAASSQPTCAVTSCTSLSGEVPISCAHMIVSQGFGNTRWEHPHRGIDIVCPRGTPVRAIAGGVFRRLDDFAATCPFLPGKHGGYGRYGTVSAQDGTEYLYGHLEAYATAVDGAWVPPGALLGYEGTTGCSSGFHLHFEVRTGGEAVNPCPYLPDGFPSAHLLGRCWGSADP